MNKLYTTILTPYQEEFVIKKSRFIGQLYPARDFDEAAEILAQVKKQYWDATHNCSAMVLGKDASLTRSSDDGEPSGTAGAPMLEALKHSGLTDVLAVVTRYFGGILLGAGGLVRAYSHGVALATAGAKKVQFLPVARFKIEVPFKLWGKVEAALLASGCILKEIGYSSCVEAQVLVAEGQEESFLKRIAELSSGTVVPYSLGDEYLQKEL